MRASLSALVASVLVLIAGPAAAATCPSGAEVAAVDYCRFFKTFVKSRSNPDPRIVERLSPDAPGPTRSIALVIGISHYPNLPDGDLKPAQTDADKLTAFLGGEQQFDEVIVLQDADATAANIDYFLKTYVPQQGLEYGGKARFLFAYSGHGVNETPTQAAALLLSAARTADDQDNMYAMADLRQRLQKIAPGYFHVLALINACYGGNVFQLASAGGNPSNSAAPGSYALTAGPEDRPVASLGGPQDGSVFFDSIIEGVRSGQADLDYGRIIAADGTLLQQGGITRLGALSNYLETEVEIINARKIATPDGPLKLDEPWIGPVEPVDSVARGGFFFLSPVDVKDARALEFHIGCPTCAAPPPSARYFAPAGPASAIMGHPEIKVFGAVDEYPVKGLDVTEHEAFIDWTGVKAKADVRFVYVRAASWAGPDKAFARNWSEAGRVGLDRGAFHVFDYCLTPAQQLAEIAARAPADPEALPFALQIQIPPQGFNTRQYACWRALGLAKSKDRILELLGLIQQHYGKTPLVGGSKSTLGYFLDSRFDRYMVWLAIYRPGGKAVAEDLGLKGANPWTLWQYSAGLDVPGIGRNVDGNVFFGSERRYQEFKAAKVNVALAAVTTHP